MADRSTITTQYAYGEDLMRGTERVRLFFCMLFISILPQNVRIDTNQDLTSFRSQVIKLEVLTFLFYMSLFLKVFII